MNWQLAQLNIARMRYASDGPEMADFNAALDSVNALADRSPGFAWRLVSCDDASEDLVFGDPNYLVNMSVWEGPEHLLEFVRSDRHLAIMKRRREWFDSLPEATMVLWWVPRGHVPTVAEAQARLEQLRSHGPSEQAFDFANLFPAPARVDAGSKGIN